jgi:hypothetical protein
MSEPKAKSSLFQNARVDDVTGSATVDRHSAADDRSGPSQQQADNTNDEMARQMEERRLSRPERRSGAGVAVTPERRTVCAYCFQRGDHPTPAHCLRALER